MFEFWLLIICSAMLDLNVVEIIWRHGNAALIIAQTVLENARTLTYRYC